MHKSIKFSDAHIYSPSGNYSIETHAEVNVNGVKTEIKKPLPPAILKQIAEYYEAEAYKAFYGNGVSPEVVESALHMANTNLAHKLAGGSDAA